MPLLAQPGLGQMLPCMPFKLPAPLSPMSPPSLLALPADSEPCIVVSVGHCTRSRAWEMTWVDIQSLLHVLNHAFTSPETRSLVRSRPEGSFCELCEPSTWHNAWDMMSTQYVCVHGLLNHLIHYLEGRMKQKSRSLGIFTVNQSWDCYEYVTPESWSSFHIYLFVMLVSYLLIDYLRHVIVRVMKDTHRWQKSREKTWTCRFPFSAVLVQDKSNSTANLWSFLQKSSSDWPTEVWSSREAVLTGLWSPGFGHIC